MPGTYTLNINGEYREITAESNTPLLYILRNHLELNGPKFGCGLQQCGACMVLLNGKAVPSCGIALSAINKQNIVTLEGLISENGELHPVQRSIIREQAAQCGYCLNGVVISSVALLNENPRPDENTIRNKLQGNICRCGVHSRVIRAIQNVNDA